MRNTELPAGYNPVAKTLHWLILVLLVVQFTLAWTMPGIHRNQPLDTLTGLHLSFGVVILAVMLLRLVWRITHPVPPPPEELAPWMEAAARLIHYALYTLLIILPLAGWGWASSRGTPVRVFGLGPLPPLVATNSPWRGSFAWVHSNGAIALLVLVGLHVLAALYHHFVRRDNVLRRMLPGQV